GLPGAARLGVRRVARASDLRPPGGAGARHRRRRVPPRSGRRFPRGLAGGRDPTDEADERYRRHGAVRGGDEALSVAVRAEGMTVMDRTMDRTKADADAALVEALRREDPEAPEHLVETYGDRVYRLALRITGSNEDAEEAAQDALWTAARKISTF